MYVFIHKNSFHPENNLKFRFRIIFPKINYEFPLERNSLKPASQDASDGSPMLQPRRSFILPLKKLCSSPWPWWWLLLRHVSGPLQIRRCLNDPLEALSLFHVDAVHHLACYSSRSATKEFRTLCSSFTPSDYCLCSYSTGIPCPSSMSHDVTKNIQFEHKALSLNLAARALSIDKEVEVSY